MSINKNYQDMKLEKQKYLFRSLNDMKTSLYREINEKIETVKNDLCPDVFQRPLYEVEKLPSRIHYGLINFENATNKIANIENLSTLTSGQLASFCKMKNFGKESLKKLVSILNEYGADLDI